MSTGRLTMLGLILLMGCGSVTKQLTADVDDYDLYRQTRVAPTLEHRLQASHRYLRKVPHGRWHAEVGEWFEQADAAHYERIRDSLPRLQRYLELLPDGPPHCRARADGRVPAET